MTGYHVPCLGIVVTREDALAFPRGAPQGKRPRPPPGSESDSLSDDAALLPQQARPQAAAAAARRTQQRQQAAAEAAEPSAYQGFLDELAACVGAAVAHDASLELDDDGDSCFQSSGPSSDEAGQPASATGHRDDHAMPSVPPTSAAVLEPSGDASSGATCLSAAPPATPANCWHVLRHVHSSAGVQAALPQYVVSDPSWRTRVAADGRVLGRVRCIAGHSLRADCASHSGTCKLHCDIRGCMQRLDAEMSKWLIAGDDLTAEQHRALADEIAQWWRGLDL